MPPPDIGAAALGDGDGGPPDHDLPRRLDLMRDEAAAWLQVPLRAHAEFQRGFLETVALDPSGLLWVSGWMRRDQPLEFPAVVLDRRKVPAAAALTGYPRDDLPADAHAVVGVLRTDWRPGGPDADVLLFFGDEMRLHQRAVRPLRVQEAREAVEHFERVRALCTGALTPALQRLIASPDNWLPETAGVAGFPAHAAVDRLLMLPGFGCLAEGWAMSPVKRVARLALRCGGRVLHADPMATHSRPRPDLREAYPACGGEVADRAGFVAVFRGPLDSSEFVDPVLKAVFADGSSTNHPVPPPAMRRIGHSAAAEDALALLPSLPHEPFFGAFAAALGRDAAARVGACEPWRVAPAGRAAVVVLPRDRSDLYLAVEEVRDLAARLPDPPGFVFLAERGATRPDVLALFGGLADAAGPGAPPCSLFFVGDVDHALHLAGDALGAVGAESFLFVGPGVSLSAAGWRAGLAALAAAAAPGGDRGGPRLLRIAGGGEAAAAGAGDAPTADAFAWTTAAFRAVLPRLPVFLGGRHGDAGLAAAGAAGTVHEGDLVAGERADGGRAASALTAQLNAAIAAAAVAGPGPARRG